MTGVENRPIRALLVEDEARVAQMVSRLLLLTAPGEIVLRHAACLAEAREHLEREPCDVVLLDLTLPDSGGLDTYLHVHELAPEAAVVIVSGLGDQQLTDAALRSGAEDYLVKGEFRSEDLHRAIRHGIERKKRANALMRVSRRFAQESDPERVLGALLEEAFTLAGADAGVVSRYDESESLLHPIRSVLSSTDRPIVVPLGSGAVGQAAERRGVVILNDYGNHPHALPEAVGAGVQAALAVPLLYEGRLLGALVVFSHEPGQSFAPIDAEPLLLLAGLAAATLAGIEGARLEGALLAARTAVHELSNQLGLTVGFAQVLAASADLPERLRPIADDAADGAMRATELLRQLQKITRLVERHWGGQVSPTIDLDRSVELALGGEGSLGGEAAESQNR